MPNKNFRLFFYYYFEILFLTVVFGSFIFSSIEFKYIDKLQSIKEIKTIPNFYVNILISYNLLGYLLATLFYKFTKKDEFYFFYNNNYSQKSLNIYSFTISFLISVLFLAGLTYAIS